MNLTDKEIDAIADKYILTNSYYGTESLGLGATSAKRYYTKTHRECFIDGIKCVLKNKVEIELHVKPYNPKTIDNLQLLNELINDHLDYQNKELTPDSFMHLINNANKINEVLYEQISETESIDVIRDIESQLPKLILINVNDYSINEAILNFEFNKYSLGYESALEIYNWLLSIESKISNGLEDYSEEGSLYEYTKFTKDNKKLKVLFHQWSTGNVVYIFEINKEYTACPY